MKIATWNVNSVRSRLERALAWLQAHEPDLLCLQEIKVVDEDFPREAFAEIQVDPVHPGVVSRIRDQTHFFLQIKPRDFDVRDVLMVPRAREAGLVPEDLQLETALGDVSAAQSIEIPQLQIVRCRPVSDG